MVLSFTLLTLVFDSFRVAAGFFLLLPLSFPLFSLPLLNFLCSSLSLAQAFRFW